MRDDFPESVKTQLAKRVGYRCSRPDCRQATSGPSLSTTEAVNMGVAAHITAASPGGARYDPSLTPEQRKSHDNGIWLCKYCGDLVDKDAATYPVELLRAWKTVAEHKAGMEVHRLPEGGEDEASEPEQRENRLENWVEDCIRRWDELVATDLANEKPSRYNHGHWTAAYYITGVESPLSLKDFREVLKKVEHHGTGWPVWWASTEMTAFPTYFYENRIECWMKDNVDGDSAHSDFWRASPDGLMFLLRGYREDCSLEKADPGQVLWPDIVASEIAECLFHARRLAQFLGHESSPILCRFEWAGLSRRVLRPFVAKKGETSPFWDWRICRQPGVQSPIRMVSAQQIEENICQIIEDLTRPLFLAFQMPDPPTDRIQRAVAELKKRLI